MSGDDLRALEGRVSVEFDLFEAQKDAIMDEVVFLYGSDGVGARINRLQERYDTIDTLYNQKRGEWLEYLKGGDV